MTDGIDGATFDLEGTVVNLEPAHHEAHLKVLSMAGMKISLKQAIALCPHFIGGPHDVLIQEMYDASNKSISVAEMSQLDGKFYKETREQNPIQPRKGFLQALEAMRKLGLATAIGSLTDTVNAMYILERSGLLKWFPRNTIVLKEDVKELKPAPDVFLETARRMRIRPDSQLVFEDSPNGVLAAVRAGSRAIGMPVYNGPEAILPLIQNGAARIFMDWREINVAALIGNLERGA